MNKKQATREYIIEKTAPVFNKKGYAGTSLNDMTSITGLTKGSIYGNFANKDEVAVEAFKYNLRKLTRGFQAEISNQQTCKDMLLVYPRMYSGKISKVLDSGGCPILNTATEADDTHPVLRQLSVNAILSWKERLINIIEKGIESGEFKAPDIDPETTALSIIAVIEGAVMISKVTGDLNCLSTVMVTATRLIDQLEQ